MKEGERGGGERERDVSDKVYVQQKKEERERGLKLTIEQREI